MVIFLDLNAPVESVNMPPWDTPYLDNVALIVSPRQPTPGHHNPAPAEPLDDDNLITWEDAEWR